MLRVAIVGMGKMGQTRAREIERHPATSLVAVADPDPTAFPGDPRVRVTRDYRELVALPDLHAVIVCTPNRATPAVVIAALEAGKHVFCEKPPGRSVQDIRDIMAAERRQPRLKLMFGFNHRRHAGIQEAMRIVDGGRFGRILWLRGIYGKSGGEGYEQSWRSSRDVCGGGILLDQGIHMVDLLRFFCGDFEEVKSMVTRAYWPSDVEDNAFALLRDRLGRVAMLHSSSTHWKHRFSLDIFMSDGYLSVNGILSSSRSYGEETITLARRQFDESFATGKPREEIIYFDTDPSWELEIADFVDCVQKDTPVTHGKSEDALKAMELVFAIYEGDTRWSETVRHTDGLARRG